jgi:hypothetical protein
VVEKKQTTTTTTEEVIVNTVPQFVGCAKESVGRSTVFTLSVHRASGMGSTERQRLSSNVAVHLAVYITYVCMHMIELHMCSFLLLLLLLPFFLVLLFHLHIQNNLLGPLSA